VKDTRQVLTQIFSQVLNLEQIEPEQDFFAIGGTSLLSLRVVWEVRQVLGVQLPARILYQRPTILELTAYLSATEEVDPEEATEQSCPPVLLPQRRDTALPLSFQQEFVWAAERSGHSGAMNAIQGAMRLRGAIETGVLERCFTEIIRRHESLRTSFNILGGHPVQLVERAGSFQLEECDISAAPDVDLDARLDALMAKEQRRPFDLSRGPLLRACLVKVAELNHVLVITLHRIVCDHLSLELIVNSVRELYAALISNDRASEPSLPVQYADYAIWQRTWLRADVLQRRMGDWRRYLDENVGSASFAKGLRARSVKVSSGILPPALAAALRKRCQDESVTLFTLLLCGFLSFHSRWLGKRALGVGLPILGRANWQTHQLIGLFESKLTVGADLEAERSTAGVLKRLEGRVKDAYALSALSLEAIAYELQDPPILRQYFDSQFRWTDRSTTLPPGSSGLQWNCWPVAPVESPVDLSMTFGEISGEEVSDGALRFEVAYAEAASNGPHGADPIAALFDTLEALAGQ
jgi:acyl carrier protein